jgi:hypothetical protein
MQLRLFLLSFLLLLCITMRALRSAASSDP